MSDFEFDSTIQALRGLGAEVSEPRVEVVNANTDVEGEVLEARFRIGGDWYTLSKDLDFDGYTEVVAMWVLAEDDLQQNETMSSSIEEFIDSIAPTLPCSGYVQRSLAEIKNEVLPTPANRQRGGRYLMINLIVDLGESSQPSLASNNIEMLNWNAVLRDVVGFVHNPQGDLLPLENRLGSVLEFLRLTTRKVDDFRRNSGELRNT